MRRPVALLYLALLVACIVAALVAPPPVALAMVVVGVAARREGRLSLVGFCLVSTALNAFLLGVFAPGSGTLLDAGPLRIGAEGAWIGLVGGLRLSALVAANLAVVSWVRPATLLEGLRLPPRATGFLAAVLIAGHDLGRDLHRIIAALRIEGAWPRSRWRRLRALATTMPALMVLAVRRAEIRRDALQVAGIRTGHLFAPVVAVSALAIAGRLALVAIPNVALTYVVVFLGGFVFGARVGFASGLVSMTVTDLLLTGFLLSPFLNAPAMGLVGLWGAALRGFDLLGSSRLDRAAALAYAAVAGVLSTFLFSLSVDTMTWLLVPEYGRRLDTLRPLLLAGLVFNVVPALANALLFGASVIPVAAAFRALRGPVPRADASNTLAERKITFTKSD